MIGVGRGTEGTEGLWDGIEVGELSRERALGSLAIIVWNAASGSSVFGGGGGRTTDSDDPWVEDVFGAGEGGRISSSVSGGRGGEGGGGGKVENDAIPPPTSEEATASSDATESTDFLRPFLCLTCFFLLLCVLLSSEELDREDRLSFSSSSPFLVLLSSLVALASMPKAVLVDAVFCFGLVLEDRLPLALSALPLLPERFERSSLSFPLLLALVSLTSSSQG